MYGIKAETFFIKVCNCWFDTG